MFIVPGYQTAIIFCFITMLCWGSWANTQKLVTGKWRYELFYWDYVLGILLLSLIAAFTLGSYGDRGRDFLSDLQQASTGNIGSAFAGGVIFNLANILLTAAIAIAGMGEDPPAFAEQIERLQHQNEARQYGEGPHQEHLAHVERHRPRREEIDPVHAGISVVLRRRPGRRRRIAVQILAKAFSSAPIGWPPGT